MLLSPSRSLASASYFPLINGGLRASSCCHTATRANTSAARASARANRKTKWRLRQCRRRRRPMFESRACSRSLSWSTCPRITPRGNNNMKFPCLPASRKTSRRKLQQRRAKSELRRWSPPPPSSTRPHLRPCASPTQRSSAPPRDCNQETRGAPTCCGMCLGTRFPGR